VHDITVQLHILSLLTFSENLFIIRSELFLLMLNTDRQRIDKRDATKNTLAKTFNNRIYTVGCYILACKSVTVTGVSSGF